jgi:hypothetical protein
MQDYKLVIRSVTPGATHFSTDGSMSIQNAGEFQAYLNEMYLSQGYALVSVQNLRVIPPVSGGEPLQYEFAYHLVKEYQSNKVKDLGK